MKIKGIRKPVHKKKVILDTNIINGYCENEHNVRHKATVIAHEKDRYLYTEHVHKEVTASKKRCMQNYAKRHYPGIKWVGEPSRKELERMPKNLKKDALILHDAVKTNADIIVTSDRKFERKADGYNGIDVMKPEEYVERKCNKNKYSKRIKQLFPRMR